MAATKAEEDIGGENDLASFVSPLVDAISQLILCAVSENKQELKEHVPNVALFTNKVVLAAKEIALASGDRDIQVAITKAINAVAKTIERLVVALTQFAVNPRDGEKQRAFALAAKEVGDSINELVVAADSTAITKILDAVADSKDAQGVLVNACSSGGGQPAMIEAARHQAQCVKRLSEVVLQASTQTGDAKKARLLQECMGDVQSGIPFLFKAANAAVSAPGDRSASRGLDQQASHLNESYSKLCDAARIVPNYSKAFEDAYDHVRRLVELALALQGASKHLLDVLNDPNHTREMFLEAARQAAETAKRLIRQAELALERCTDPARRAQIKQLIEDLRAASAELIKSAREASEDPNNPEKRKRVVDADKRLQELIQKMVALTSADGEDAENKLLFTSQYVDGLMEQLCARAADLSRQELLDFARRIGQGCKLLAADARAVADQCDDPKRKKEILDAVAHMESTCSEVIRAISALADNPGNPKLVENLTNLKEKFNYAVHRVRAAAGLEELRQQKKIDLSERNDDPLVVAARRQAEEAIAFANEAALLADAISDPAKKKALLDAVAELRARAEAVLAAAQAAAADPSEENLRKLDDAQHALAGAVHKVVTMTSEHEAKLQAELDKLMSMAGVQHDATAYALAQEVLELLRKFLEEVPQMEAKDIVARAKAIAQKATELAKLLRKIAAQIKPPEKKQMQNCASLINDRSIQLKLLAAVAAASNTVGDSSGQVSSAAKTLVGELNESVQVLRRAALKRRVDSLLKQTERIKAVIAAWRKNQ